MDKKTETELFEHLARNPRLVPWLELQVAEQVKVLLVNPNMDQIQRAQGAAAAYKTMLDRLAVAKQSLVV